MFWVEAMLEAYHKLHPKPKTVVQLKDELQWIWSTLLQKFIAKCVKNFYKRLEAGSSANGEPFEHNEM